MGDSPDGLTDKLYWVRARDEKMARSDDFQRRHPFTAGLSIDRPGLRSANATVNPAEKELI
jgi:hypothetical protein